MVRFPQENAPAFSLPKEWLGGTPHFFYCTGKIILGAFCIDEDKNAMVL
jgi:hypothetical protein